MAEAFEYKPLSGDIRLVVLEEGVKDAPIRCKLVDVEFADEPTYISLSYEWGAASTVSYEWGAISNNDYLIYVDGLQHSIRKNLYLALQHLRQPDREVIMWIDALCINQHNIAERSLQVQLMGKIYSCASQVVIWLGTARNYSDLAMTKMEEMSQTVLQGKTRGREIMKTRRESSVQDGVEETEVFPGKEVLEEKKKFLNWKGYPESEITERFPEEEEQRRESHTLHIAAIASWCKRSYWRRMWVVQEIQLAKQLFIHCGEKKISWSAFTRARECMADWHEPFESEKEAYESMRTSLPARMDDLRAKGRTRQIPLIDWLETFEASMCTEPKDKVYALVGLASDCQNNELTVDYSKSMSQIFFDVLRLYFGDELSAAGSSETCTANVLHFSQCLFKWLRMDSRDDRSVETYDERLPKERIWIRGIYCGPIAVFGNVHHVSPSAVTDLKAGLYPTRVLIAPKRLSSVRAISSGMSSAFRPVTLKGSLKGMYRALFDGNVESGRDLLWYDSAFPAMIRQDFVQFRVVITEYGMTIVVPPTTNSDDLICLLPQCDIALIFRRFSSLWILEGCGIYGMSEGRPTQDEAVQVSLDIRTLQKVSASAEFDPKFYEGTLSWRRQ